MRRPPAVARVLERLTATAREHEMFLPGQTVLVAVSGGPDSVCLVESLVRLRRLFKVRLEVFHLDHGLRDGSREDAVYVRRTRRAPEVAVPPPRRRGPPRERRVRRGVGSRAPACSRWARWPARSARRGSPSVTPRTIRPRPC